MLYDTSSFTGETIAGPNVGSLRGFNVIDTIKSELEDFCLNSVSYVDNIAIAARDFIVSVSNEHTIYYRVSSIFV